MYLIQLLLPLYNNHQQRFPSRMYEQVRSELTERFGGLTAHVRAPATGLWKEDDAKTVRDDIVSYEVMAEELEREWWQGYRIDLEKRFEQELLIIRATHFEQL